MDFYGRRDIIDEIRAIKTFVTHVANKSTNICDFSGPSRTRDVKNVQAENNILRLFFLSFLPNAR